MADSLYWPLEKRSDPISRKACAFSIRVSEEPPDESIDEPDAEPDEESDEQPQSPRTGPAMRVMRRTMLMIVGNRGIPLFLFCIFLTRGTSGAL